MTVASSHERRVPDDRLDTSGTAAAQTRHVVTADLDGDGVRDLVVANSGAGRVDVSKGTCRPPPPP
ncbi:FG-GAP repeat protein [Streptomyces sp. NBC_00582]|uniref:FG-GAP repeat protein n=1 Tax=Streptomyces sp. NBC_00582 TaxID=2975783 RepID=UPI002E81B234|nr:FG-GAP repeat protein [Streptomyces sp. NBC_00582]WUB61838.1 VCBS repeat-containing protein [Streptomyces sp. NBC_00582]